MRLAHDVDDQLTALVNAHAAAVLPGVSASVNAVLAQLEREPGEFIVDPWVSERQTLVDLPYPGSATADAARVARATVIDGLEVLVRQGAASFERWTGVPAPLDVMRNAVRSAP